MDNALHFIEKELVAGVDEVGRGPLAGPVITAAVILKSPIAGLRDSKSITPKKRESLVLQIQTEAIAFSYGRAEVDEIDAMNIHHATLLAMKRAIEALAVRPSEVLVDGLFIPAVSIPCKAIVSGDNLIQQIAAAAILAKVARDAEMVAMDLQYPGYDFAKHKGYPTVLHRKAIKELGVLPVHRKSFAPVSKLRNCK